MQVLTAYLTDPGWRPAPFEQIKASSRRSWPSRRPRPAAPSHVDASALLATGDAASAFPDAPTIAAWTDDELKAELTSSAWPAARSRS